MNKDGPLPKSGPTIVRKGAKPLSEDDQAIVKALLGAHLSRGPGNVKALSGCTFPGGRAIVKALSGRALKGGRAIAEGGPRHCQKVPGPLSKQKTRAHKTRKTCQNAIHCEKNRGAQKRAPTMYRQCSDNVPTMSKHARPRCDNFNPLFDNAGRGGPAVTISAPQSVRHHPKTPTTSNTLST